MVENVESGKKIDEGVELKNYSDEEVEKPNIPKPKTSIPQAAWVKRTG